MKLFSGLSLFSLTLATFVSVSVFALPAKVVNNSYSFAMNSNWDFGGKIYFRCDSIEATAKEMLQAMGARNVQIKCYGGITDTTPSFAWDSSLDVKYDSVTAASSSDTQTVQADYSSVVLKDYQNCFMANQLFKRFQKTFSIKNLSGFRSCSEPDTNYKYSFDVLK